MARTRQGNHCAPNQPAMPLDAVAWSLKAIEPIRLNEWMDNGVRGVLRHVESCKIDLETHLRREAGQAFPNGVELQRMGTSNVRRVQHHDDYFMLQHEVPVPSSPPMRTLAIEMDNAHESPQEDACERMIRQMSWQEGSRLPLTVSSRNPKNIVGNAERVFAEPRVAASSRHELIRVSSDLELARECLSSLGRQVMSQLTSSLPSTSASRQSGAVLMTLAPSEQQLSVSIGALAQPMPSLQLLPRFSEPQESFPAANAARGNEGRSEDEEEKGRDAKTRSAAKGGFKMRLGRSGKRLVSGAIAGGVSRTVVAPLETIRTHLMVGSSGERSVVGMFRRIVRDEGWKGLFRGNLVNVIRVAPAKAIELFTYDVVKRALSTQSLIRLPVPPSSIAGSSAGIASCILTYPLELIKTRITVQPGVYRGMFHALYRIASEEGVAELYRGLLPSVIGVIPYAGANYCAYDTLCTLFRRSTGRRRIDPLSTLLIGSLAGAAAATATFPLEVSRKQMQVGALKGRLVYRNTFHCMRSIVREQGVAGLYRGLLPSCVKLMPAAGISFMCYEVLKRILIEEDREADKEGEGNQGVVVGGNKETKAAS